MNNFPNHTGTKQSSTKFPISPQQAFFLVAASVVFVGFLGFIVRAALERLFGDLNWNSPFLLVELLMIVPVIWVVKHYHLSIKHTFRFNKVSVPLLIISSFLGLSVAVIGDQLDRIVRTWFPIPVVLEESVENVFLTANLIDFWLILGIATFGAGICEEMLFRGFLQGIFEKKYPTLKAVLIPAILFGLIHILPWLFIQIIFMGLVLGLLAWRTNSIYPSIIVHAANNLIGSLYLRFHTQQFDAYYLTDELVNPTLVLIAIAVFIGVGKWLWTITKNDKTFFRDILSG